MAWNLKKKSSVLLDSGPPKSQTLALSLALEWFLHPVISCLFKVVFPSACRAHDSAFLRARFPAFVCLRRLFESRHEQQSLPRSRQSFPARGGSGMERRGRGEAVV